MEKNIIIFNMNFNFLYIFNTNTAKINIFNRKFFLLLHSVFSGIFNVFIAMTNFQALKTLYL